MIDRIDKIKTFVLDMDGTIYNENEIFDGTLEFLEEIRQRGAQYIFITNNSSKSVKDYVKKVNDMGIFADEENFYTSSQATAAYIKENYMRKISLASVAEHVGLSSGYLCRIFKDETGGSINTYINNLRMNKAGELLSDKNSYIKEVAVAVGFEDQLYFSRLFKRYSGLTPSEYRASKNPQ